jgi:hypothetical protein
VDFRRVFSLAILGLGFNSRRESELDNDLEGKVELIIQGFFGVVIRIVLNGCWGGVFSELLAYLFAL